MDRESLAQISLEAQMGPSKAIFLSLHTIGLKERRFARVLFLLGKKQSTKLAPRKIKMSKESRMESSY